MTSERQRCGEMSFATDAIVMEEHERVRHDAENAGVTCFAPFRASWSSPSMLRLDLARFRLRETIQYVSSRVNDTSNPYTIHSINLLVIVWSESQRVTSFKSFR